MAGPLEPRESLIKGDNLQDVMPRDLVIIGAGPAGLTAGIFARTRELDTLILEALNAGGQLASLYPEKGIGNYPGIEQTEAGNLANNLAHHAKSMGCEIHEREKAFDILDTGNGLEVVTEQSSYESKAVIVASGAGLFHPKKLGVEGEDRLFGKGVYYKLPERASLTGKRVMFVGGGNTALEMALLVAGECEASICHRRPTFRADEALVERLEETDTKRIMDAELAEIKGKDQVESVVVSYHHPPHKEEVPMDAVVINIGVAPEIEDLEEWDLKLEDKLVDVDTDMRTSRKGVFACGDVVAYKGKFKQIVVACGEAAIAANSAYKYIKEPYWA